MITVTDLQGLAYEARAQWPTRGRLIYNRTFRHNRGSYSLPLRPDLVFIPAEKSRPLIFDAKFRFRSADWQGEAEEDQQPERLAQRTDLYKMHTYRDALGAQAALVLFPGDQPVFYHTDGRITAADLPFEELIQAQGIGAIQLEPGKD